VFAEEYVDSVKVRAYSSDLTPRQWDLLKPLIHNSHTGRPIELPLNDIVDGIFYKLANGCKWRDLPHDFPDYRRVNEWFVKWRDDGTWDRVLDHLRRLAREAAGHDAEPSEACLDSQTVKAAATGGGRGYDGGKKTNGRKRHILVDTLGLLLAAVVTVGSVSDSAGAVELLRGRVYPTTHPRLRVVHVDSAYDRDGLKDYLRGPDCQVRLRLVIRSKPKGVKGFVPVKKRWVVERTFGWFGKYRGLARDYETNPNSSEATLKAVMVHVILQRKLHLNTPASHRQPLRLTA
jgi:putative transposase